MEPSGHSRVGHTIASHWTVPFCKGRKVDSIMQNIQSPEKGLIDAEVPDLFACSNTAEPISHLINRDSLH